MRRILVLSFLLLFACLQIWNAVLESEKIDREREQMEKAMEEFRRDNDEFNKKHLPEIFDENGKRRPEWIEVELK
jgi:hypothetical protein